MYLVAMFAWTFCLTKTKIVQTVSNYGKCLTIISSTDWIKKHLHYTYMYINEQINKQSYSLTQTM